MCLTTTYCIDIIKNIRAGYGSLFVKSTLLLRSQMIDERDI